MPKRRDQRHVSLPQPAAWLDVDGHLSLVAAFALIHPSQVHHAVHGPVLNIPPRTRRRCDRGARRAGSRNPVRSAAVLRKSSGSRSVSEVSFVPGIGSLPAASSKPLSLGAEILPRPNQLPRRSRTRHRTRVGRDSPFAGSKETVLSISVWKSSAPPCTGRAQTSSRVKSGAISRMRQGARFVCCVRKPHGV